MLEQLAGSMSKTTKKDESLEAYLKVSFSSI